MDFVAIILSTNHVFHLQCLFSIDSLITETAVIPNQISPWFCL